MTMVVQILAELRNKYLLATNNDIITSILIGSIGGGGGGGGATGGGSKLRLSVCVRYATFSLAPG